MVDNNKCGFECKKIHVCEKDYVWNPSKCIFENRKYWASIMDDSAIICDEVIKSYEEEIKNSPTNFNEKKVTYKTHILLAFLLITIALLITVSSYCYMMKYQTKQLLPFHGIKN